MFPVRSLCSSSILIAVATGLCPSGTIQGLTPDACFVYLSTPYTSLGSEETCVQSKGHLSSVDNPIVNSVLPSVAKQGCTTSTFWLGGSYNLEQVGRWSWSDGQRFSYTNWTRGQPNSNGTFCLSVDISSAHWYSENCEIMKPSICRVPALKDSSLPTLPPYTCPTVACRTTPTPHTCPPPSPRCPKGWSYVAQTRMCYQVQGLATWSQGLDKCRSVNATLVSIPSDDANYFIQAWAKAARNNSWLCIGLHDGQQNRKWQWTDGTPLAYTKWQQGSPGAAGQYCSAFSTFDDTAGVSKTWFTVYCDGFQDGWFCYPLCQMVPYMQ